MQSAEGSPARRRRDRRRVTDGKRERNNRSEIDRRAGETEYMQEKKVIKVDWGSGGEGSCLSE